MHNVLDMIAFFQEPIQTRLINYRQADVTLKALELACWPGALDGNEEMELAIQLSIKLRKAMYSGNNAVRNIEIVLFDDK